MIKGKEIVFVTASDETAGSTRQRVFKIANELTRRGYSVKINRDLRNADILIFQKSYYGFLKKRFFRYRFSNKFLVFDVDDLYTGDYLKLVKYCDLVL